MIVIYHSRDLDGYCSAAICKHKFPDAKLIGYDYGQPISDLPPDEPVIMIDVSVSIPDMLAIAKRAGSFTWIDHHISQINEFHQYWQTHKPQQAMITVLQEGRAACELAWEYFFPGEIMPAFIRLLGKYDTWRNSDKESWENEILPFQWGMRQICNSAESFPEWLFDQEQQDVLEIIRNGKAILTYQAMQNERACRSAFETTFEGLRALCLNVGGANSDVFKSVWDPQKHDIMMPFTFMGKYWVFSIYTTKPEIDCSVIAKKNGGGGHRQAAGFQAQRLESVFPEVFIQKIAANTQE